MNKKFNDIILIGYGGHTRNKIIPAIKKSKINIKIIVTMQKIKYENAKIIKSIKNLIYEKIDKNKTVVLISTPPNLHYNQINFLLKNNFNIICEKPILLNIKQFNLIIKKIKNKVLVENFMFFYTKNYYKFLSFWNKNSLNVNQINLEFLIPELPKKTFRNNYEINNSYIYDIGCYPLSLLSSINISLSKLKILKSELNLSKHNHNSIFFFSLKNLLIKIKIGIDKEYSNKVTVNYNDNKKIVFDFIFYGIEKYKTISYFNDDKLYKTYKFKDENGFKNILSKPINYWKSNQQNRYDKIKEVTFLLHKLSKIYKKKLYDKFKSN